MRHLKRGDDAPFFLHLVSPVQQTAKASRTASMRLTRMLLLTLAGISDAFIGISIDMYQPSCAHGCRRAIRNVRLACTETEMEGDGTSVATTTAACYGRDPSFLTTLAWCIQGACKEEPQPPQTWELEKFWTEKVIGQSDAPPKWSYAQTLQRIAQPPSLEVNATGLLNYTAVVPKDLWLINKRSLEAFEHQEALHTYYGLALLLIGALTPVAFTLLLFFPLIPTLIGRIRPYLVYPSTYGGHHVQALPQDIGNAPTMGQGLYIVMFVSLNIIYTAVGHESVQPNAIYKTAREEILLYIANRTGVIAFALLPLVILFASRNNFLLWITNWSHATYLLFHRHVARIFMMHCTVHSIVEIKLYRSQGVYVEEMKLRYWIWGVVATVAACALVIFSVRLFRGMNYEIFLILHIVLAVLLLVGCWYHVGLLFKRKWGYEYWLYIAFGVWGFDRGLRLLRLARNGVLRAEMQELGTSGVVRVDILNVHWSPSPGQHAYISWPGLSWWRAWQNHPFSVIPLSHCQHAEKEIESAITVPLTGSTSASSVKKGPTITVVTDLEKAVSQSRSIPLHDRPVTRPGIRLYVKKHRGLTSRLRNARSVLAFLEGPYRNHNVSISHTAGVLTCDKLILLAGGIGITGVASWIRAHPNVQLYWSVREHSKALVDDVQQSGLLDPLDRTGRVSVTVTGGEHPRRNLMETIEHDAMDALHDSVGSGIRVGVISCGSPEFCDSARSAVVDIGRRTDGLMELRYVEEAFGW